MVRAHIPLFNLKRENDELEHNDDGDHSKIIPAHR